MSCLVGCGRRCRSKDRGTSYCKTFNFAAACGALKHFIALNWTQGLGLCSNTSFTPADTKKQITMALKATIYKAQLQIADMDRSVYADHNVIIARHPSEADERMMIRLLAFALNVPADDKKGKLEFAKDLWDVDEAALWHKDYTEAILHWIDVGQPDDKRLMRAAGKAERVTAYSFSSSTPVWWKGIETKLTRASNLVVWQIEAAQSQALAKLAERSMQLQVTVQDGTVWMSTTKDSVEITPRRLTAGG